MGNQVRYGICLVLFLLLNIAAIEITAHAPMVCHHIDNQELISVQRTDNRAVMELLHIFAVSTVGENITIDHNSYDLKFIPSANGRHYSRYEQIGFLGGYDYVYLHPNLVGYYIYQLHKIII